MDESGPFAQEKGILLSKEIGTLINGGGNAFECH
jgi:hypothetical protein